jgi:hypothetical protein
MNDSKFKEFNVSSRCPVLRALAVLVINIAAAAATNTANLSLSPS